MAIDFIGGDDFIERFLIETSDGEIADLTGCDLTISIWWPVKNETLRIMEWTKKIELTEGEGIEIISLHPDRAEVAADQVMHGTMSLTEEQTLLPPVNEYAGVRATVTADGVTSSSNLFSIRRIP